MADEHPAPMIRLDPGADGPPALSYNVPDPTSYSGRSFIALDLGPLDPFSPQVTVAENGDAVLRLSGASGSLVRLLRNSGVIGFTRGDSS